MARRSGGRKARVNLRAAPLPAHLKPVGPGESGGQYKPLSDTDIKAIKQTIYRILDEVGFQDPTPHCIETCTEVGAIMGNDGRLRMPPDVVDRALQYAARNITLFGQEPEHDVKLSSTRVHFATAGAAVLIADSVDNSYRESTAQDLYDLARITDTCEHIHIFQRMCVLRDIEDNYQMDLNTLYCAIAGTSKHVGSSWVSADHLQQSMKMLHQVAGGEDKWRARPFVSQSNCFVVPPMKFTTEGLKCLRIAVEGGMPVLLLSAGQAGATAPPCLAGTVAQAWAECLGGLVYVNAIKPGAPAIVGTWPFVSDLRTGAMSGGSPEQGLLSAACAQMSNVFDLPFGTACGMTDAKLPDMQAGAERAYTLLPAALSGANIVYEAAGMYASLLGTCPESLLLDNDILGACLRVTRGIQVNEETLGFDTLKQVCTSDVGHYLATDQTLKVMQSEYFYPEFSDRSSPTEWESAGSPGLLERAVQKKNDILASHFPRHIGDDIDVRLRSEFPIFLSAEDTGRG